MRKLDMPWNSPEKPILTLWNNGSLYGLAAFQGEMGPTR